MHNLYNVKNLLTVTECYLSISLSAALAAAVLAPLKVLPLALMVLDTPLLSTKLTVHLTTPLPTRVLQRKMNEDYNYIEQFTIICVLTHGKYSL